MAAAYDEAPLTLDQLDPPTACEGKGEGCTCGHTQEEEEDMDGTGGGHAALLRGCEGAEGQGGVLGVRSIRGLAMKVRWGAAIRDGFASVHPPLI